MNTNTVLVSLLLSLSVSGCGLTADEEPGDAEHERFVAEGGAGKADTGGIAEGTAQALGVLHVANTLTEAQLKSSVGLSTAAAGNISAYKAGDDEAAATADDQQYETLAELDSIPFVGPIAFGKLLTYAEAEGFTDDPPPVMGSEDPFDPAACAGVALSQTAANARWQTNQILGSYQLAIRKRSCPTSSTCGAWSPVDLGGVSWRTKADGQLKLAKYDDTIMLQTVHGLCNRAGAYISPIPQYVDGAVCSGVGHTLYCGTYAYPRQCISSYASEDDAYELPNGLSFAMEGKLTENCAQLHASRTTIWGNDYEAAILVRY